MKVTTQQQFEDIAEECIEAAAKVRCSKVDYLEGLQIIQEQLEVAIAAAEESLDEDEDEE